MDSATISPCFSTSLLAHEGVYTAVPLLETSDASKNKDVAVQQEATDSSSGRQATSTSERTNTEASFFSGVMVGILCFCVVDSKILPAMHFENQLSDSIAMALMWTAVTSILTYGVFWTVWTVLLRLYKSSAAVQQTLQNGDFVEAMEHYFILGVFLGFSLCCIVSVILSGIPLIGVLIMVAVAALWTMVMVLLAPPRLAPPMEKPIVVV